MKVHLAGIEMHYEISGSGPWITLSHSLASHSGMWNAQLETLNKHFTVLRYDTRGHGQTQATPGPYTLNQLSDDACQLLNHLGVKKTHWLGLSLGGMIGQTFAIQHPEILDHVVIADSSGRSSPAAAAIWGERAALARQQGMQFLIPPTLERWFTDEFNSKNPNLMAEVGQMISATPIEGYAGCCAAIAQLNTLDQLREMRLPCLILVGEQDTGTPPAMSELIHQHWPSSKLKILSNAAHIANIEQAHAFTEAVMNFLPH
jgi:3-oxoadipate enol-lactonase